MRRGARGRRVGAWMMHGVAMLGIVAGAACDVEPRPTPPVRMVAGADAVQGRVLLEQYGCGACHLIPGVRGATGLVGPPLIHFSQRRIVAGEAANTPEWLIAFIVDPDAIRPGTAMPPVGATERDARHMAAYLYTLR